jgi:hypothetical protein
VKIGSLGKEFQVYRSLLVRHSEYFRKALAGPWKEAEEQAIILEDVEPRTCEYWSDRKYFEGLS